jgi:hypothetical protein
VISDPLVSPSRIFTLLGYDNDDLASAQKVIAALLQRFPENEFFARQVFPKSLGAQVFEPLGFVREPLNQFLMQHDLP